MNVSNQFTKVPKQGKTIFNIMAELALQYQAIDLSKGYPEFNPDPQLIDLVYKYMKNGHNHYADVDGVLALRETLAQNIKKLYDQDYNPQDEITISNGATEAIATIISAFIREKDEVIIFEPSFDCYAPAVRLNGGIPILIDMVAPDFQFDWDQVQLSVTSNTRMIIINSPHNPTGTILNEEDIERLKRIINGTNILILSDEVFDHIIFDQRGHRSLLKYPDLKNRTLVVNSFSKTFHVTGWRLGYVVATKELMLEFRKVHRFSMYTASNPVQHAFSEYLSTNDSHKKLAGFYQKKRDLLMKLLQDTPFIVKPSNATYFQCIDFSEISDEPDFEFASHLVREYKIAAIPLSYLYKSRSDNKILRLSFAQPDEILKKAAQNLKTAAESLNKSS